MSEQKAIDTKLKRPLARWHPRNVAILASLGFLFAFVFPVAETVWTTLPFYEFAQDSYGTDQLYDDADPIRDYWIQSKGHVIGGIWLKVPVGVVIGLFGAVAAEKGMRRHKQELLDWMCAPASKSINLRKEFVELRISLEIWCIPILAAVVGTAIESTLFLGEGLTYLFCAGFSFLLIYPTWKSAYLRASVMLRRDSV